MAMSSRKSSTVSDVFHSIIGAILFVSLCYASSGVTAYQFSQSTLNLVNDTSAKYPNQTVPTNIAKSRSKRSVVFPTGSDLTVTFAFQYPIQAVTGATTTFDVDVPFAFELDALSSRSESARKLEDEHATILEMVQDLLNKFGLNGKACIMRLICELAESEGLPYNGVLGKALETLFLLDYGFSTTERLYDYVSARAYGEHEGNCHAVYYQCPISAFKIMDDATDLVSAVNNFVP